MHELLIKRFLGYLQENNPDVLAKLQEEGKVHVYLQDSMALIDNKINLLVADGKHPSVIEEVCMDELTKPLKPSKYLYIKAIVEEDFPSYFKRFTTLGILSIEVVNMVTVCHEVFNELPLTDESEDNRFLRYAVLGAIHDYLKD